MIEEMIDQEVSNVITRTGSPSGRFQISKYKNGLKKNIDLKTPIVGLLKFHKIHGYQSVWNSWD